MKRLLIIFIMMLFVPVFADTIPFYTDSMPKNAIGLYQTDNEIVLRTNPDMNAPLIKKYELTYDAEQMPVNMFAVLLNNKKLGFLYVTDIEEDGWVEVIYDKQMGAKGWVKTQDNMQFLPWINFYNLYGRKYGLSVLKDAPKNIYTLYSQCEDNSQALSKLNYVKKIRLVKVSGNWALVTVLDLDKTPKSGWLKWRNTDGTIYAFPAIK